MDREGPSQLMWTKWTKADGKDQCGLYETNGPKWNK